MHAGNASLLWVSGDTYEPYHRHFDAYTRLKMSVSQDFEQETCLLSRSTFCGKVMRQNGFWAKLCVSKTIFDSSIQARWAGEVMRQSWRIYGLSDTGPYAPLDPRFAQPAFLPFSKNCQGENRF